ncbi:hypothetical protein GGTG_04578 [Gaeumannomyces tritici R3-111a-1]|uniref:Uncharacterized protein n=1 Tax=Gaeumannomyces tritici (strain R3-111a-1) TaxID=644352 RepID=J3NTH9_GAET3|nr:hypothetical protein GGTG_04578 [Gaeumannomyces tritici R3-111a-1]EJT79494.1 hypothetical protein GGTG_04578 [Gaeumannomyces tritici R3-111a-1]
MPYPREPKPLKTTSFSLALQLLPLKLLAPKAALPGVNTDAALLRETAQFLASAKLGFSKLFEKLRYRFGQPFVNGI